jgi:hypothetical protein
MIDLMIIGAQKAGTTSLKNYLGQHPQIITHPHTEFTYFADDKEFEMGYEACFLKYFNSISFDDAKKVIAKNVSLSYDTKGLKRLAEYNPNCQIVFILRNPIERAYSAYQMAVRDYWLANKPFSYAKEAIKKHQNGQYDDFYKFIINLGIYHTQIESLFQFFPQKQVSFILFEDLKIQSDKVCKALFEKLGCDASFVPNVDNVYNKGGQIQSVGYAKIINGIKNNNTIKKAFKLFIKEESFQNIGRWLDSLNISADSYPPMDRQLRQFLLEYYKPHTVLCEKLINKDLSFWNN